MAAGKDKKKKGEKKGAKKVSGRAPKKARRDQPVATSAVGRAVTMSVVPEPPFGARTVLAAVGGGSAPVCSGGGGRDFRCGGCGAVLLERVEIDEVAGIVCLCPSCASYNEIPT